MRFTVFTKIFLSVTFLTAIGIASTPCPVLVELGVWLFLFTDGALFHTPLD